MNTITAIRNRILQLCEERNLTINKLATISAVSPETKSQGLFHQIHKEVTFCGLPHEADA